MKSNIEKSTLMQGLQGKTALVTGGASGIGLGIARVLHEQGVKTIVLGRNHEKLKAIQEKLGLHTYEIDITDFDNLESALGQIVKEQGHIDILINNAGNHYKAPIEETSIEKFDSVLKTHVYSSHLLSKILIPSMKKNKSGNIIFIASMSTFIGMPMVCAYNAAKSAMGGMVRGMASELAEDHIRVNAIAPGWIDTEMFRKATDSDQERFQKIMSRIPMKRVGTIEDIGNSVAFLCSDWANYITGVVLPVDGGALIGL